jgi:uncharacterized cupredoxin-like copper-binding protein
MTRRSAAAAILVVLGALLLVPIATSKSTATTTVKVTALDTLKFKLSRTSAPAGKVVFKVKNAGKLSHDFKIAGKKTKLLSGGKTATLTVTLKKGKSYPYECTVPGHAAAGMKGVFKAK